MIDVLVAGKFVGAAVERTASSGKTFVTSKLRTAESDGETQFVNLVAFDHGVKSMLLALSDGDSVAVSGAMKVSTYEARDKSVRVSLNVVASAVLSAYGVKRKREAVRATSIPKAGCARPFAAGKRNGERDSRASGAGVAEVANMQDDDIDF